MEIRDFLDSLQAHLDQQRALRFVGMSPGALARMLAAQVELEDAAPKICVVADDGRAKELAQDVRFYLEAEEDEERQAAVVVVPEVSNTPWDDAVADPREIAARLGALQAIGQNECRLIVVSVASLLQRVVAKHALEARRQVLATGDLCDRDELVDWLVEVGYERAELVDEPGTFSVRGGVLDIFVPLRAFPVRIDLDVDCIERLRFFDPESQRGLREIDSCVISAVRETIVTTTQDVRARVHALGDALQVPSSRTKQVVENLAQGQRFLGIEALIPLFHDQMSPLWTYLPAKTTWWVEDDDVLRTRAHEQWARYEHAFLRRSPERILGCEPSQFLVALPEVLRKFDDAAFAAAGLAISDHDAAEGDFRKWIRIPEGNYPGLRVAMEAARADRQGEILRPLLAQIEVDARQFELAEGPVHGDDDAALIAQAAGMVLTLVAPNRAQAERLYHVLAGHGLDCQVLRRWRTQERVGYRVRIVIGDLSCGYAAPQFGEMVLSEQDVFGKKTIKSRRGGRKQVGVSSLAQLRTGDFVVHSMHGIGRYLGLFRLPLGAVEGDFVQLEYHKGDKLYLPVHRLSELERYKSGDEEVPKLDRMGGVTFAAKTSKVKADVRQFAEELLQLYAKREAMLGHAFDPPGELYEEFEATFPFEETPDQATAIAAVQEDLSKETPMDRIICGDVGFGKTEVALRAAFRVASSGKQVAILAPTTVLVSQHFQTFQERMRAFPITVRAINRFAGTKEIQNVLKGTASGEVDIVIGTHRLLGPDVRFRDLGLLIIDEEQRFGVKQKERLKQLKSQVDLLTLTATPIPRTLHLALMGMRSICMMTTAPVDRLSVHTHLVKQSDQVIQDAVSRELARGGQVYYVVPRVEGIDAHAQRIRELVPEARVIVAHGQLADVELERAMLEFVNHEHDVLVATTIIESGLDIPRANTMLIARSDLFGLAQLYQLRGRVGRSKIRAECYLMVASLEKLTAEARKRLEAIARNSELGAGFNIASHDLEIRGAGDVLGARQSGSMQKIGFQAYARALAEAVAELRGEALEEEISVDVNFDIPGFIPDDFVEDVGQRLEFYRRFGSAQTPDEVAGVVEDLHDRFGHLPLEVMHYSDTMLCRVYAKAIGATSMELRDTRLSLRFGGSSPLDGKLVQALIMKQGQRLRFSGENRLVYRTPERTGEDCRKVLQACADMLRELMRCCVLPSVVRR